ncbi:DUF2840 domain-containing protein [Sphingobium baderi]|uniref:Glycosidase n=1 Tax=Sphingobium baderi TaxID=1332080 RepID=A0A0S3EZT2_9SPHN|nr:DUF2840 domain-containing protein [Sphingobium baderi]ALR20938.1 glycosidase [Sphingobium baderi]
MIAFPDDRTRVDLLWIEKKIERWIRFGRPIEDQILDRRRRRLGFAPDSIFAFVRWASNDFGTVVSRIDILRAVSPGEPHQTVPGVIPGGDSLLRVSGWPKVQRVFEAIDAVDALGIDPADVAPDHWRHVHNRLAARETPRPYTLKRHRAWIARKGSLQ